MKPFLPALLFALLALATPARAAAQDPDSLDRQAMDAYGQKDYARSADLFAQAVASAREDEAGRLYNAACASALAGRTDAAFGFLRRAIESGYDDAAQLQKDADLVSLRSDARWPALLDALEEVKARARRQWNSPALATPWRDTLTEDERVAGLSRLWSEAKFNFVNFDKVPGLDWDALYLATLPKVRAARTTAAYYRELAIFMAHLKDGHSGVWPAMDRLDTVYARPGLETRRVEGRVLVDAVLDPRLSAMGIARGWEIVAVEGEPVRSYAEREVAPLQPASTEQDRLSRTYERALLAGDLGSPVSVGFRDARGRERTLVLPRIGLKQQQALGPQGSFEWRMLPGDIAWVQLRSFGDDSAAKAFEAAFGEISRAAGVILDVRENGGGNSSVGYRILSTLTDRPFQGSAWMTRDYRPTYRAWGRPEGRFRGEPASIAPSGTQLYARPVVVLTSPRTYSAAEDFAVAFDAMERGRIVGEPTGGSTGQPLLFPLPGGGQGRVCTKRDTYPDGREFVGVGVQPDLHVAQTLADHAAGRDTVLERAAKMLRGRDASMRRDRTPGGRPDQEPR